MDRKLLLSAVFLAVLAAVCTTRSAGSANRIELSKGLKSLSRITDWNGIGSKVFDLLTILSKHQYLLSCLPRITKGNCLESSEFCRVQAMKVYGKPMEVRFSICKRPARIILKYRVALPILASGLHYLELEPITIPFDLRWEEGIVKIDSSSTTKASAHGIPYELRKVTLKINGMFRWDCTKPAGLLQRVEYNTNYDDGRPGYDFNKRYYKLNVRIEFKVKKPLDSVYRCQKCIDLINIKGHVGEGGPEKCNKEISNVLPWLANRNSNRGSRIFRVKLAQFTLRCPLVPFKHSLAYRIYLFYFLGNPKKYNPGTRLVFAGLKKRRERADLLEFLKDKRMRCPNNNFLF